VKALGLRKMSQEVIRPDNAAIRGMLGKVEHLVEFEEIETPEA
jgi:large subunit ribosomal protein L30